MSKIQVTATNKKLSEAGIAEVGVDYDFGDNLDEAVELFGKEVVYSHYKRAATIFIQDVLRRWAISMLGENGDGEVDPDELQKKADELVLGVSTRVRTSKIDKAKKLIQDMTPEQLAEYEEYVKQQIAAAKA